MAGNVVVWDLATGRPVQQFATGSTVWSIVFLERPRGLVTHGKDAVLLFNLESGEPERKVDLAGGTHPEACGRSGAQPPGGRV